jgi:hypothetical protein
MGPHAEAVTSDTTDHDALPLDGTLYTAVGGLAADPGRAIDYPIEAQCKKCLQPILAERPVEWYHTGRRPGDPR